MDCLKKSAVAAAAGLAMFLGSNGARAADMMDAFLEPILPVEVGSSWYLRGDIGYKLYTTPDAAYSSLAVGTRNFYDQNLSDSWLVGGGVGYKFNPWFRTDLTVDYSASSNFDAKAACLIACAVLPYSIESGKVSAWTILANAYFDLGTWAGITPYVGAGLGTSNVRLSNYYGYNPPFFFPTASVGSDANTWSFSWAVMAGASVDLTQNWLLDMNYRYLSLGSVNTVDQFGGQINIDDIASHEFRVGFRFLID